MYVLKQGKKNWGLAVASVLILALGLLDLKEGRFAIIETLSCVCILVTALEYGFREAMVMGAVFGSLFSFTDGNMELLGAFTLMGLGAGAGRKGGRIGTILTFLATTISLGAFVKEGLLDVAGIKGLLSGITLFLFIPRSWLKQANPFVERKQTEYIKEEIQNNTRTKLRDFAGAFRKLEYTFQNMPSKRNELTKEELADLFRGISCQLCVSCTQCDQCLKENYYDTYHAVLKILCSLEEGGLSVNSIPAEFASRCIHLQEFLIATNQGYEMAKMELSWKNRLLETRGAIAGQLGEVAEIIDDFSTELTDMIQLPRRKEEELIKKFQQKEIEVKQILLSENKDKAKRIYFTMRTKKGRMMTSKEAANIVSKVLEQQVKPAANCKTIVPRNFASICFVEDTQFTTLTGVARLNKTGEQISGDNFSFLQLESGKQLAILSDGMGTGQGANKESEMVVEMLEQLLEAGFSEPLAIKLLNSVLVLKSDGQVFSTLDLTMVDLYTGVCEFIKIGASVTFVKRDRWVEVIQSTSLPVGIFQGAEFDRGVKKLYDGDMIIMVSDGVIDQIEAEDKEGYIKELLLAMDTNNPQELVSGLLETISLESQGNLRDDITALCIGVWKK